VFEEIPLTQSIKLISILRALKMHMRITCSKDISHFNRLSWNNFFKPNLKENSIQTFLVRTSRNFVNYCIFINRHWSKKNISTLLWRKSSQLLDICHCHQVPALRLRLVCEMTISLKNKNNNNNNNNFY